MRDVTVPTGFRLPVDVLLAIDEEVARRQRAPGRATWTRITRSEVVVDALRKALPPAQRDEQKKKKKPARRAA